MSETETREFLTDEQKTALGKFFQIYAEITKQDVINFLSADDIVSKQVAQDRYNAIKDLDEDHAHLITLKKTAAFHRLTGEEKDCIKNVRYYVGIHDIRNMITVYNAFFQDFPAQKK